MAQVKTKTGKAMRIDLDQLKQETKGRWLGIFDAFGIDVPAPKSHGPCPVCGGKDRFWLDEDANDRGGWFCNQCTVKAGDGWALVQRALGLNFKEVMERVAKVIGSVEIDSNTKPKVDPEKRRKMLNEIWQASVGLDKKNNATDYLLSRGLYKTPLDVRYCQECYNSELKKNIPAMVAKFSNASGQPVALQRTYLIGQSKADLKSPRMTISIPGKRMAGGAVRLYKHDDLLGVCEGIEDAISCMQLFNVPTWATLSNTLLEGWVPPDAARRVIVFGDNDPNFAGQSSAYKLANRLYVKFKRIVEVRIPENFKDWNAELMHNAK